MTRRRLRVTVFAALSCLAACQTGSGSDGGGLLDDLSSGEPADLAGLDLSSSDLAHATSQIKTVFVIMMENHSLTSIKGSSSAPYINNTLLPQVAHAEMYFTPPGNHPSEPNYIWLEAGDNLGITNDNPPAMNHQSTPDHLVSQLDAAGISWKTYQEGISGTECPLTASGLFDPKHAPMLFFDDVTGTNSPTSAKCIAHVRPFSELASDLASSGAARYNFITPNLCDDMHGQVVGVNCQVLVANLVKAGDDFLAATVPQILASAQYMDHGALFILWDEGDAPLIGNSSDGPLLAIVASPLAKVGYTGNLMYTHSSTLRTIETIFGVPFLRDAKNATDLRDLFTSFP